MKGYLLIVLIFAIGLTSCEEFNSDTDGDFLFKIGDDLEYSYNDEDGMQQLIDIGVDGLITNYPDKALKYR